MRTLFRSYYEANYNDHEDPLDHINLDTETLDPAVKILSVPIVSPGIGSIGAKALYVGRTQKKSEREQILRHKFEEWRKEQISKCQVCSNVYVKNIDDNVTENELQECFSQCGTITSAKLMVNEKEISKGFGFLCYSTPDMKQPKLLTLLMVNVIFLFELTKAVHETSFTIIAQITGQTSEILQTNMHNGENKGLMKSANKASLMPHYKSQPPARTAIKSRKEELLVAEVAKLKEQLKTANMEKSELSSGYEKLSIIFRSQRQQLHGIKLALASSTPPNKSYPSSGILKQELFNKNSSIPDQNAWQAFPEHLKTPSDHLKPIRPRNSHQNMSGATVSAARSDVTVPVTTLSQSQCVGGTRNNERNTNTQPAGWVSF
ncbi:polyadenylate-binding protein 7 [Tanacetum coccineum]